ncbi:Inner nuclear membrane SRC1 [Lecanosticta acicola]|uniref:Inner nuclear membrane SRC1 n=1 Tax=Lecanosticta acicola TaxID=111012 RepID=A0AAI9E8Z9_9PEZI|nr:Inner nuclear membrane SRC1 [Lecanosticta acicola]
MGGQAYLEPGFDPNSLTVPKLRSILLEHGIDYSAASKKSQLVQIFHEELLPQARKIKQASARIKRTSRGIEDVTTGRKGTGAGDEDEEIPPTPATGRSTRRTTRARTEEVQEVVPTSEGIRHSTAPPEGFTPRRSVSGRRARAVEPVEEEPAPKTVRRRQSRTRYTAATPAVKTERAEEDSPFSNENVFQSASPPPLAPAPDTDRRRTTLGSSARDLERRHRELRRRTDGISPAKQRMDGYPRKSLEKSLTRVKKQEEVEPTEEFTPEEQLDLDLAQQTGELVPTRRKTKKPSAHAKWGVGAVFSVMAVALGAVWRQEKLQVGYCGVGSPSVEWAGVEVPKWAEIIRPECEPCPPHAACGDELQTECENGFVLTQHPFSLNGLIPIPPTCEPDSVRAKKVKTVKERAVEALREQNAKYECGEATAPAIKETDLKKNIAVKRRKGMSNDEFEDLWQSALGEILDAEEVVSGSDGTGQHAVLRSTSLAAIPFACAVRRSLRETLRHYFWQLVAVLLVLSGGTYGRRRITSSHETEAKAKKLASLALEKLSLQAAYHAAEPEIYKENYISVAQLRDDVLRDEFSASRRKKLWERVQRKVEGNANVRPMVREGRSGDVGRVWEWVGAVGYLESPQQSGENRRRSGRVSFAGDDSRLIEPSEEFSESALQRSETKPVVKKWSEGRGTYY